MVWRNFLIILTVFGVGSTTVLAEEAPPPPGLPICAYWFAKKYQNEVKREGSNDKFRHCAISCVLTRSCGPQEAMDLGILKEIADLFGPGNAELEDLTADMVGITIGMRRSVRTRPQCYDACAAYYPRNL